MLMSQPKTQLEHPSTKSQQETTGLNQYHPRFTSHTNSTPTHRLRSPPSEYHKITHQCTASLSPSSLRPSTINHTNNHSQGNELIGKPGIYLWRRSQALPREAARTGPNAAISFS